MEAAVSDRIDRLLNFEVSILDLIVLALIVGIPYGLVGVIWAFTHTGHLSYLSGADKVFSFLGEIVAWPVLLFADVCLR